MTREKFEFCQATKKGSQKQRLRSWAGQKVKRQRRVEGVRQSSSFPANNWEKKKERRRPSSGSRGKDRTQAAPRGPGNLPVDYIELDEMGKKRQTSPSREERGRGFYVGSRMSRKDGGEIWAAGRHLKWPKHGSRLGWGVFPDEE